MLRSRSIRLPQPGAEGDGMELDIVFGDVTRCSADLVVMKHADVFICKLRKKLLIASGGKNYIETVWGRGYVIRYFLQERG